MAADDKDDEEVLNKAIGDLATLQHVAQHAPVHDLVHDLVAMLNDLGYALDQFNDLAKAEPCSRGYMSTVLQGELAKVVRLSTHIAIYTLGICHRSPEGFSIGLPVTPTNLN